MSAPRAPGAPATAYLVERYLPPRSADDLPASVARVVRLCSANGAVQYLNSAYLPLEDTCFCLFRATSAEAVRQVNIDGEFPLDRITSAVLLRGQPR